MDSIELNFVKYKGNKYIKASDIVWMLYEFASTEETDVRNRMKELIAQLK